MKVVDYYLSPVSPWTYLGHARFADMARRHGATIRARPVDYGVIFPVSGGLPLGKRAPQRQAYRLVELARWRDHLGLPLTLQPKFFPVDGSQCALLIAGAAEEKRMAVAGDVLAAVWMREENIADPAILSAIAARNGIADIGPVLEAGKANYAAYTEEALARNVFGAPTYSYAGELFWGQDRLDFLERSLARA
jgi:2-hydroxychromene-2-carboxylate isomerase